MEQRPIHPFSCECDRCGSIVQHRPKPPRTIVDRMCIAIMILGVVLVPGRAAWAALAHVVSTW